jgi:hypothetical protein
MSRIVALFSNQKEAEKAVTALAESPLDEPKIHLIEDLQEDDANVRLVPAQITGSGLSGVSLVETEMASLSELDDAEGFLRRSVQKGGVATVIDLSSSSEISLTKGLLEKMGGRIVISRRS